MDTTKSIECKMESNDLPQNTNLILENDFIITNEKVKISKKKNITVDFEGTESINNDDTEGSENNSPDMLEENQLLSLKEKVDMDRLLILQKLLSSNKKTLEKLYRKLHSRAGLKLAFNEDNDDKGQSNNLRENIESISTRIKKYISEYIKNNSIIVNYTHSKKLTELALGRRYAQGGLSLQNIPGVFREYLLVNSNEDEVPLNTDIDLKNSQPSIALDLAKDLKLDVPVLEDYVNNRHKFFDTLYNDEGIDRVTAKIKIISMLNSQDFKKNKPYTKELQQLDKEFKLLQNEVYKNYKYSHLKGLEDNSKNNPKGSFLNLITTIIENKALTRLYNTLINNGYKVNTLIFDGLLIRGNHYQNNELLEICNKAVDILDHTKLQVSFKPLGTTLKDLLDEENDAEEVDDDDLAEATPSKSQLERDKEKTDEDWVEEISELLNKDNYITDNSKTNYYANPIGGNYISTNKEGLQAEIMRNIRSKFKGRKFLEKHCNLSRIASAYMIVNGIIELDTANFDKKNVGIPFKNGVFRVEKGIITKATPEEKVMKTTGYDLKLYDYTHPDIQEIEKVLMECFKPEDHDYIKYQTGNLLLGSRKQFFILYGATGNNGKTKVYCEILVNAFQNLSANMKHEHITTGSKKSIEGASPETLVLKSSFINIIPELNDDSQLDANALKNLSGGNRMSARNMYDGVIQTFSMKGIMLIDTNKTGNINGYDEPTDKRMVVLHFPFEFVNFDTYQIPRGRDKNEFKAMKDVSTLFNNIENINSKCFSLMYHYYKNYSNDPNCSLMSDSLKSVRETIAKSVCSITKFLDECCEFGTDKNYRISCDDIWNCFNYQQSGNVKKISKVCFYGRMESLNYAKKKIRMYKRGDTTSSLPYGYEGLRLKKENINKDFIKYFALKTDNYTFNDSDNDNESDNENENERID